MSNQGSNQGSNQVLSEFVGDMVGYLSGGNILPRLARIWVKVTSDMIGYALSSTGKESHGSNEESSTQD